MRAADHCTEQLPIRVISEVRYEHNANESFNSIKGPFLAVIWCLIWRRIEARLNLDQNYNEHLGGDCIRFGNANQQSGSSVVDSWDTDTQTDDMAQYWSGLSIWPGMSIRLGWPTMVSAPLLACAP